MAKAKKKRASKKRTPTVKDQILTLIRRGTTIENAAESAGIHRDTFYEWVRLGNEKDPEHEKFARDVMLARAHAELTIFMIVRENMLTTKGTGQPDVSVAQWWLKCRNRGAYAERHEVTGPEGGPLQVEHIDISLLSDEGLKRIAAGEDPKVVLNAETRSTQKAVVAAAVARVETPLDTPHAEADPQAKAHAEGANAVDPSAGDF